MPKIDITRTELIWPDKYDEEGRLAPLALGCWLATLLTDAARRIQ